MVTAEATKTTDRRGLRPSSIPYRPALDGLRAIAVLAVFVFHLNNAWLPGGFLGVDVFFVISGFLITSILLHEQECGHVSLGEFYQRRISRLFPAFFTVALATTIAAYFFYSPQDLASCGANLAAATLSLANIKYMQQGNYFAISPDAQPFLHYWSLAVEEQFYLLYPATLLLIHLRAKRWRTPILTSFCIASLIACIVMIRSRPTWAFYLLPTRAWELLAGGILATRAGHQRKSIPNSNWHWPASTGMTLIIISFVIVRGGTGFSLYIAMLAVLGTLLVIGTNYASASHLEKILSWRPMVFVGQGSYSLYLWHWPIFSMIDYQFYQASPSVRIGSKIALSFTVALLCFLLIENPSRVYLNNPRRRRLAFGFLGCALVTFVPLGVMLRNVNYINAGPADIANGGITFTRPGSAGALMLMGDSHGSMFGTTVRRIANELNLNLNVISTAGSDTLPSSRGQSSEMWLNSMSLVKREMPDFILLSCHWRSKLKDDRERLKVAVDELKRYTKCLIIIMQPPELPPSGSREAIRNGARPPFLEDPVNRAARIEANAYVSTFQGENVIVLNIDPLFAAATGEVYFTDADGHQLYHDSDHLSGFGSDRVKVELLKIMKSRLHAGYLTNGPPK